MYVTFAMRAFGGGGGGDVGMYSKVTEKRPCLPPQTN